MRAIELFLRIYVATDLVRIQRPTVLLHVQHRTVN